jgi:phosphatidylinositol alpha-1,6-mannosyltransferase
VVPEGWIALGLKRRLGIPYACYVHGEELAVYRQSRELSWMARRVLRSASRVIVNSHNTLAHLRAAWPESAARAAVIHPGVDTSVYVPADHDEEGRAELGWSGKKVVLTVGRLQRRKGHDKMIEALPAIRRLLPDILYAIVGAGEERGRLEQTAERCGVADCVRFYGELTDASILPYYQQCDLFALPNRTDEGDFEGFGMVLVEAQSCGRPVLSGDSGGAPETLINGETGVVVDCREADKIAGAVSALLGDPERLTAMGKAARRRAADVFDWERLAHDAESFLKLNEPSTVGAR